MDAKRERTRNRSGWSAGVRSLPTGRDQGRGHEDHDGHEHVYEPGLAEEGHGSVLTVRARQGCGRARTTLIVRVPLALWAVSHDVAAELADLGIQAPIGGLATVERLVFAIGFDRGAHRPGTRIGFAGVWFDRDRVAHAVRR
jgi:hypothetical protein